MRTAFQMSDGMRAEKWARAVKDRKHGKQKNKGYDRSSRRRLPFSHNRSLRMRCSLLHDHNPAKDRALGTSFLRFVIVLVDRLQNAKTVYSLHFRVHGLEDRSLEKGRGIYRSPRSALDRHKNNKTGMYQGNPTPSYVPSSKKTPCRRSVTRLGNETHRLGYTETLLFSTKQIR